jgi:hypothetical protein
MKTIDITIQAKDSLYDNKLNYSNDDIKLNKELYTYLKDIPNLDYNSNFSFNFILKEKIDYDKDLLKNHINLYYNELHKEKLEEKKDSVISIIKYMFFGFLILYFYIVIDEVVESVISKVLSEGVVILAWLFIWEGFDDWFDIKSYKEDLVIYKKLSKVDIFVIEDFNK